MESSHKDKLIIAGSGNVALNIYKIANILSYNIVIIDNREEMLTRERFPEASELIFGDIVEQLTQYDITEDTSIVLVSHQHRFDLPALKAVISSPARYIGVLGNRRKVVSYYKQLNSIEIPESLFDKVHMPMGMDLGGQLAAEIALSVMAEIQAVKYNRSGGFVVNKKSQTGVIERDELF